MHHLFVWQHVTAAGGVESPGDELTLLLTAEGLLFAALAIGVSLQAIEGRYMPKIISKGGLAFLLFVVILAIAIGALASWWELYGSGFEHHSVTGIAPGLALVIAIVAQPTIAFMIWLGVR